MRTHKGWLTSTTLTLAILADGTSVLAQDKTPPSSEQNVLTERRGVVMATQGAPFPPEAVLHEGGGEYTYSFVSSEMSFDNKVVKGAPYSAEAVTETIQTLADGNRIVRKTTASVYRDSEGRTRRDQTLGAIGPFATNGDVPQMTFINDPVASVNYILDSRSRTARKLALSSVQQKVGRLLRPQAGREVEPLPPLSVRELADLEPEERQKIEERMKAAKAAAAKTREEMRAATDKLVVVGRDRGAETAEGSLSIPAPPPMPPFPSEGSLIAAEGAVSRAIPSKAKTESLGKQTIEGVEAEGTRSTMTIPAGEIGNELPINIVSERWYSPELQTIVMTRRSDPRMGETVYRLTNINRSEPARSLFEVPADYTIKEGPGANIERFRIRRPNNDDK